METYAKTQTLFRFIVRTPKEHSSFLYFQMESNEGVCFYSTLEASLGTAFRDIEIQGTIEFKEHCQHILDQFAVSYPLEYIEQQEFKDSRD
jgi:hypothetical protein